MQFSFSLAGYVPHNLSRPAGTLPPWGSPSSWQAGRDQARPPAALWANSWRVRAVSKRRCLTRRDRFRDGHHKQRHTDLCRTLDTGTVFWPMVMVAAITDEDIIEWSA